MTALRPVLSCVVFVFEFVAKLVMGTGVLDVVETDEGLSDEFVAELILVDEGNELRRGVVSGKIVMPEMGSMVC